MTRFVPAVVLAAFLGGLLLIAAPFRSVVAQGPDTVLNSLSAVLNKGEARELFSLPPDRFWRAEGPVRITLMSDGGEMLKPTIQAIEDAFGEAAGLDVDIDTKGVSPKLSLEIRDAAKEVDLVVAIGPRQTLAGIALNLRVNRQMLERFELGTWPFVFLFTGQPKRVGYVMIAGSEPPRAIEASLILAVVWALGGATLGPEMENLIDPDADAPSLTPLGQQVFALMYDERLEPGLPLAETLARAREILPK